MVLTEKINLLNLCVILLYFIYLPVHSVVIERKESSDVIHDMKCNNTFYKEQKGKICKCDTKQSFFTSYIGPTQATAACRNLDDLITKHVTCGDREDKVKINDCEIPEVTRVHIWNYRGYAGIWMSFAVVTNLLVIDTSSIVLKDRSLWDGLLVKFDYTCQQVGQTILVKFIGKKKYPLPSSISGIVSTKTTKKVDVKNSPSNMPIIIGIIVATIVAISATVLIVVCIRKRRRNTPREEHKEPLYAEYSTIPSNEILLNTPTSPKTEETQNQSDTIYAQASENPTEHNNTTDYALGMNTTNTYKSILKEHNPSQEESSYYSTAISAKEEVTEEYAQVEKHNQPKNTDIETNFKSDDSTYYYSTAASAKPIVTDEYALVKKPIGNNEGINEYHKPNEDNAIRNQNDNLDYYSIVASVEPNGTEEHAQVQKTDTNVNEQNSYVYAQVR